MGCFLAGFLVAKMVGGRGATVVQYKTVEVDGQFTLANVMSDGTEVLSKQRFKTRAEADSYVNSSTQQLVGMSRCCGTCCCAMSTGW